MSQENVEIVVGALETQGRLDLMAPMLDPNIDWDISAYPLPDFPDRGAGRAAFLGHLGDYLSGWNDYESTVRETLDVGDEVVLILHERARMRSSGVLLERDLAMVWTVRGGICVRFRVFQTRGDALEAVGLAE